MREAHPPWASRRALALAGAFFVTLFLANVLLHGPPARELLTSVQIFRPSTQPSAQLDVKEGDEDEERVVLVMVMFGLASAREGQHMLKSALMRSSKPLDVHVVCSPDAVPFLQSRLDLVTRPARDVFVQFYPITPDKIAARAERAGVSSKHHAGLGGLVKIFLHELLPSTIPLALYVDTDAFFASDPHLLWQTLRRFTNSAASPQAADSKDAAGSRKLLAFPRAGHAHANGALICSCVMALDLAAMRAAPLMASTLIPGSEISALGTAETWAAAEMDPHEPPWGDQGLLWAMWRRFPERFERLSRSWDISACRGFYRVTLSGKQDNSKQEEAALQTLGDDGEDGDGVEGMLFPGIVHFNCQEGEDSVFENAVLRARPEWGPMLGAVAQFKWVWLNTQPLADGADELVRRRPMMRTHVVPEDEVRFLDELIADGSVVLR